MYMWYRDISGLALNAVVWLGIWQFIDDLSGTLRKFCNFYHGKILDCLPL